ncbi:MAG: VWA domain-containing protein [Acidimicrobiia bacterium]
MGKLGRALLAVGLGIAGALGGATMARGQAAPASREEVLRALGADQVAADYVVILDTSASMQDGNKYDLTLGVLRPFLLSLAPSDYLSLVSFDTAPGTRYSGDVGQPGDRALGQLPPTPTGQHTDIGAALETGLTELERLDASRVSSILLLTDGKQDPPPGSPYPASLDGPAWEQLQARAQALQGRQLTAFGIGVGQGDTDAAVLKRLFPQAQILGLPPDQIGPYLDRLKDETRIKKAASVLTADLSAPVEIVWPTEQLAHLDLSTESTSLPVTVVSKTQHLPLELGSAIIRSSEDQPITVEGLPETIALAPGEAKTFDVDLTWKPVRGFDFGQHTETRNGELQFQADITSAWDPVITQDLKLSRVTPVAQSTVPVQASGLVGWSWLSLLLLAAGLLVLVLVVMVVGRSRLPKMHGSLTAYREGELVIDQRSLRGRRKKLGRGNLKPSAGQMSGSVKAIRRPDPYGGGTERGIRLTAAADGDKRKADLFAGDSVTVGKFDLTYEN